MECIKIDSCYHLRVDLLSLQVGMMSYKWKHCQSKLTLMKYPVDMDFSQRYSARWEFGMTVNYKIKDTWL